MPIADADDAELADRRVEAPLFAVFFLQAGGAAEHAAEIADILAEHHDARIGFHRTSCAFWIASIIVRRDHGQYPASLPLAQQMRRHLLQRRPRRCRAGEGSRPDWSVPMASDCFWAAMTSAITSASACTWRSSLHTPLRDQMRLEPQDRIAERPGGAFLLWPVGGRIVGGRVRRRPGRSCIR